MTYILLASFAGLLFALLMMIVGVPAAYFCKGEVATASMMGIIILAIIVLYSGIALVLLTSNLWLTIPIVLATLLLLTCLSFRLSLLIYTQKIRLRDRGILH